MGDAADDAFNAAERRQADLDAFWDTVRKDCTVPPPYRCDLVPAGDQSEFDLRCTICGKEFYVDF
jgi:RNAse (barnase) inhibitor barstar